jgi:hypothetical protein
MTPIRIFVSSVQKEVDYRSGGLRGWQDIAVFRKRDSLSVLVVLPGN